MSDHSPSTPDRLYTSPVDPKSAEAAPSESPAEPASQAVIDGANRYKLSAAKEQSIVTVGQMLDVWRQTTPEGAGVPKITFGELLPNVPLFADAHEAIERVNEGVRRAITKPVLEFLEAMERDWFASIRVWTKKITDQFEPLHNINTALMVDDALADMLQATGQIQQDITRQVDTALSLVQSWPLDKPFPFPELPKPIARPKMPRKLALAWRILRTLAKSWRARKPWPGVRRLEYTTLHAAPERIEIFADGYSIGSVTHVDQSAVVVFSVLPGSYASEMVQTSDYLEFRHECQQLMIRSGVDVNELDIRTLAVQSPSRANSVDSNQTVQTVDTDSAGESKHLGGRPRYESDEWLREQIIRGRPSHLLAAEWERRRKEEHRVRRIAEPSDFREAFDNALKAKNMTKTRERMAKNPGVRTG